MIWPHTTIILLNEVGVSFCDAFKILFTRPGITNVSTHIVVFSCSSHICGSDSPCPLHLHILNLLWNCMEQMKVSCRRETVICSIVPAILLQVRFLLDILVAPESCFSTAVFQNPAEIFKDLVTDCSI